MKKIILLIWILSFVWSTFWINLKWCYKKTYIITAYYSPIPWQKFYINWNYQNAIKVNGYGIHGASWKTVFNGMLAAPTKYKFWTQIYFPFLNGGGKVEDRWGAIVAAWEQWEEYDRIDIWAGKWYGALMRALSLGKRTVVGYLCPRNKNIKIGFNWNKIHLYNNYFQKILGWMNLHNWKKISKSSVIKKNKKINIISYKELREKIEKEIIKSFLRTHKFYFNFHNFWVYQLWKYGYFDISLKNIEWKNYKYILPGNLNIIYNKKYFSVFYPSTINILNGSRKVTFLPKKSWVTFLTIKLWNSVIFQKTIRILKPNQTIQPKYWKIISLLNKPYIWDPTWWISLFQDKSYLNLINTPFKWTYYLTSNNKNITFCKAPTNTNKLNYFHCSITNMWKTIPFTYHNTIYWLFVFKFFSNSKKETKIFIKNSKWQIITSKLINFQPIKITNPSSLYAKYIHQSCEKWLCLWLIDRGYIWSNKKLSKYNMKQLLRNMLLIWWKKIEIKTSISEKFQFISRKQFINYLFLLLWIKVKNYNQTINYIDMRNENQKFKDEVIYLTKLGFSWKDEFAHYHFQPNKYITVWAALYLTNFLLSKYIQ